MKKILLITYHYPPSLAVGGHRMVGFSRHLPLYNWKPYVLTITEEYVEQRDDATLDQAHDVTIFRARKLPTLIDGFLTLKRFIKKAIKKKSEERQNAQPPQRGSTVSGKPSETFINKIKRFYISLFVTLPDAERNWFLPGLFKAIGIIRHEKIDVILTSSPPHSVQILGLLLKKIFRVKWVADFRDPWMTPFSKGLYLTSALSNRIEKWLERKIVENADLVLTTTGSFALKLGNEYAQCAIDKFKCIPNGFDEDLFLEMKDLKKDDVFTISYTGSIYLGRSPEPIFQAVKELMDENKIANGEIKIKLVGNCRYIDDQLTSQVASSYGLESMVNIVDYVHHAKALEIIKTSHLVLLLATNQPLQIPAKVYDYMASGTKVLALTQEGATADLINHTNMGIAVDPIDIEGVKAFIYSLISNKENITSEDTSVFQNYNKKALVKELAQQLNTLL